MEDVTHIEKILEKMEEEQRQQTKVLERIATAIINLRGI